ncbi:globin [Rhodopila sp.]|jgi:hemoglobin-like flavoprotein|uniref:globin n=1 Tax=Rhodopila sp. TaxID=2480087 RepID=UPI002C7C6EFD|nr:globin [Rhodopila sp.]HVZ08471.1 globin [Rhodopila sp.]
MGTPEGADLAGTGPAEAALTETDAAVVRDTLEQVSARVADPTPHVFRRLFQDMPETEALFVRDGDALVRGQMFQVTMESLMDFLGDRAYGASLIQIERINHQGLGVETEMFDRFYWTVMGAFRDILGDDWTPAMDTAWTRVITALTRKA